MLVIENLKVFKMFFNNKTYSLNLISYTQKVTFFELVIKMLKSLHTLFPNNYLNINKKYIFISNLYQRKKLFYIKANYFYFLTKSKFQELRPSGS